MAKPPMAAASLPGSWHHVGLASDLLIMVPVLLQLTCSGVMPMPTLPLFIDIEIDMLLALSTRR
jgi:hypothetical protein